MATRLKGLLFLFTIFFVGAIFISFSPVFLRVAHALPPTYVTPLSQSSMSVSRDASGSDYEDVYRCVDSGCTPTYYITIYGTYSYTDTGLSAGTTYVYKMCGDYGCTAAGYGTTDAATPGVPTIGSASPVNQSSFTVTWTRNSPLTESGFEIYQSDGTLRGTAGAGATSGTASGLSCGTSYQFYVRAYVTTNGRTYYSGNSGLTAAATSDQCTPGVPTIGTASATGQTTATVNWTRNSPLTEDAIDVYDGASNLRATLGAGATSANISGLTCGTSYQFFVQARVTSNGRTYYSGSSSLSNLITTSACNSPPTASPTNSGPVNEDQNITFYANATDPDNNISSYQWYSDSGCSTMPVSGQTGSSMIVYNAEPTTTTFYVKVTDSGGLYVCSAGTTGTWNNVAPTASTVSGTGTEAENPTVTASVSDPGGSTFTYQWYNDSVCTSPISGVTSASHNLSNGYGEPGTWRLYYKAWDANGAPSNCAIGDQIRTNLPPHFQLTSAPTQNEGTAITYTAQGSDPGTAGLNLMVERFSDSGCTSFIAGTDGSNNPVTLQWTELLNEPGSLTRYVKVTDTQGLTSNCQALTGTWTNVAPDTPTIINPPSGGSWINSRLFCATVSDTGGGNVTGKFVIGASTYNGSTVASNLQSCYTYTADLSGQTWYAYATDANSANSGNTVSQTANIDTVSPDAPTCTPAAGTYNSTQSVSCSSSAGGSAITTYWTLDSTLWKNGSDYMTTSGNCPIGTAPTVGSCTANWWDYSFTVPTTATYYAIVETSNTGDLVSQGINHNVDIYVDGVLKGTTVNPATDINGLHQFGVVNLGSVAAGSHTVRVHWTNDWCGACGGGSGDSNMYLHTIKLAQTGAASVSTSATLQSLTVDAARNASGITTAAYVIDTVAPTFSVTDGASASWVTSDTIAVTVSDTGGSGAGTTTNWGYSADNVCNSLDTYSNIGLSVTVNSDHTDYVCFRNTDAAGNVGYSSAIGPLKVDVSPPAGTTNTPGSRSWANTNVTVSFSASDSGSSGVSYYQYCYTTNGTTCTPATTGSSVTFSTDGQYTVCSRAVDAAGNIGAQTCSALNAYQVDKTLPTTFLSLTTRNQYDLGWTATFSDSGGSPQPLNSYSFSNDGINYDLYQNSSSSSRSGLSCGTSYTKWVKVQDGAGNVSNPASLTASTIVCSPAAPSTDANSSIPDAGRPIVNLSWSGTASGFRLYKYLSNQASSTRGAPIAEVATTTYPAGVEFCPAAYNFEIVAFNNDSNITTTDSSCQPWGIPNAKCSLTVLENKLVDYCTRIFLTQ